MKRLHLHVTVPDLSQSIRFYATLFGAEPSVVKDDYAKWMLEDPRVNFAISTRARAPGLDHVGIQVDSPAELAELADRLKSAGAETLDEAGTTCCYAKSDKSWVADPAGVRWETFYTFGEAATYGEDAGQETLEKQAEACCGPARATESEPLEKPAEACCGPAPAAKTSSCCG